MRQLSHAAFFLPVSPQNVPAQQKRTFHTASKSMLQYNTRYLRVMQTVLDMLKARKSVRAYEPIPVEAEKKRALFQAALEAPSAGNMTLFSILDITDPALKQRLSVTCDNQPFIASAPVCACFYCRLQPLVFAL